MKKAPCEGVVSEGHGTALRAAKKEARKELVARYSEQLAEPGFWHRVRLRFRIIRESRAIARGKSPRDALYVKMGTGVPHTRQSSSSLQRTAPSESDDRHVR